MNVYQEIIMNKVPEITPYFIWSNLYMQVHLAFVEQQLSDETVRFGVSFPDYRFYEKDGERFGYLGHRLRIFANTKQELEQLDLHKWLSLLSDYVCIKSIELTPKDIDGYLQVNRYQGNLNLERLTRRFMRRESKRLGRELSFKEAQAMQNQRFAKDKGVSLQEAEKHYQQPQIKNLPFIKMQSLSSDKVFSLQIDQRLVERPQQGTFNTYGLSSKSTVPNFA